MGLEKGERTFEGKPRAAAEMDFGGERNGYLNGDRKVAVVAVGLTEWRQSHDGIDGRRRCARWWTGGLASGRIKWNMRGFRG